MSEPIIIVDNIHKSYLMGKDAVPALRGVTLNIEKGDFVSIAGPSGSGKSTTLATILDLINQGFHKHIVTIEDPIEFIFHAKQCLFTQREVGNDTYSFAHGLKSSLRQAPDVIFVGIAALWPR